MWVASVPAAEHAAPTVDSCLILPGSCIIKWPGQRLKGAASGAAGEFIRAIADGLWNFASTILKTVFALMNWMSKPTIVYTPDGPLGDVFPICLWIGLVLSLIFAWLQVGTVVINGPKSLFFLLRGAAQWALAWASALVTLSIINDAATLVAAGIIKSSFKVNDWSGLAGDHTFMESSIDGMKDIALACMSVIFVIPFAIGLLTEMLVREAAMEVLAATFPIIIAGVLWRKTARWFWTGIRWMLALIFMLPLIALSMAIGHSIAVSSMCGSGSCTVSVLPTALVAGVVNILSLLWPLLLFKLFAFVDPNTVAGSNFRSSFSGGLGNKAGGGGEDTEGAKAEEDGTSDSGAGGDASGAGFKVTDAAGAEGGDPSDRLEAATAAMSSLGDSAKGKSAEAADDAVNTLDGVGAGHPGGGGTPGSEDEDDEDDENQDSDADSHESSAPGDAGSGDDEQDDPQMPTTPTDVQDMNQEALPDADPVDPQSKSPAGGDESGQADGGMGGQGGGQPQSPGSGGQGAQGGEAAGAEEAAVVV